MRNIIQSTKNHSSPLYILGAGSIGLLHASCMRVVKNNNYTSSLPTYVLLRSRHKDKLIPTSSFRNRSIVFPSKVANDKINNSLLELQPLPLWNSNSNRNRNDDEFIIAAFKDIHNEMRLLDLPAKIIDDIQVSSIDRNQNDNYIQNILLCTKAPDAVKALESIIHLLHPTEQIHIVIMTNGSMGVVSDIKSMINGHGLLKDRIDLIYASTTHGAHRGSLEDFDDINVITKHKTFNIHHAGLGYTYLENTTAFSYILSDIWNEIGLRVNLVSTQEMNIMNWKKLATNCAINALTALRRCSNGALLDSYSAKDNIVTIDELDHHGHEWNYNDPLIFYQLIREVSDVAIADAETKGQTEIRQHFQYENLVYFVKEVVSNTSNNKSSMLQDILHQRYPTEIQYLNGYIVDLGHKLGINVTANELLCHEVETLTKDFKLN